MKFNWKEIGKITFEVVKSISKGDMVLRMKFDKLFPYILYLFFLGCVSIWLNYRIEQTILKMERNKAIIEGLQIDNTKKTFDLVELGRISNMEMKLQQCNSPVQAPEKPANRLK